MTGYACSAAEAKAAAENWLSALGSYRGRLPPDDPLVPAEGAGWLVSTLGRELALVVDQTFPFTKPRVYVRGEKEVIPHVESNGRICLRNPELPRDPVKAVATAVGEARSLLRAIEDGSVDEDFKEDFSLYWLQQASLRQPARLLLSGSRETCFISWTATGAAFYGFASPDALRRWWRHRFRIHPTAIRQGAFIALNDLPHPADYPKSGDDLWRLLETRSSDGTAILGNLIRQMPRSLIVVLAGVAPSGRRHAVSLLLMRPIDKQGKDANRRAMEKGYPRGRVPPDTLCSRFVIDRLRTEELDAAVSRLPYAERTQLADARVAIVGCGALGSGVARLLAKSGVGHFALIDPETLSWENIRRHDLGAPAVGLFKASALAQSIAQEIPDIGSIKGFDRAAESLLVDKPNMFASFDLVISCAAAWSANSALDGINQPDGPPILYGWMEAYALAAHAVLIMPGDSYVDGFDDAGNPRMTASISDKPMPVECGGLTSQFGAVDLSQAEALTSRLALDFLRGKTTKTTWRTWLTDADTCREAEGRWTSEWVAARGQPDTIGGISSGSWWRG